MSNVTEPHPNSDCDDNKTVLSRCGTHHAAVTVKTHFTMQVCQKEERKKEKRKPFKNGVPSAIDNGPICDDYKRHTVVHGCAAEDFCLPRAEKLPRRVIYDRVKRCVSDIFWLTLFKSLKPTRRVTEGH